MILHPTKNNGRVVKINGVDQTILTVLANGNFRIASEENGPKVNDYRVEDIESAATITVSLNDGVSWISIPVEQV